jgi:tetratricopeptide (TPR) repeat protein
MRLFQEAIRLDPGYALAHAQLAYAYVWTALFMDTDSTLIDRAESELDAAERIEPRLGFVPFVRSQMLYSRYRGWRIDEAIAQFRRAGKLDPALEDEGRADFAFHLGLEDEWRRFAERAVAQDPMNHRIRSTYVNDAYLLMRPELGRRLQKNLLGEEPDIRYWSETDDLTHTVPDAEQFARAHPEEASAQVDLAAVRVMQGRCREADSLARAFAPHLIRDRSYHHTTFELAQLYARCGDADTAVAWLEETVRWGFLCYPLFERDPWLDPVRKSPEFVAFMARVRPSWERARDALVAP